MTGHGYNSYTRGCRCDVCKAAKAERLREYRRSTPADGVRTFRHGTCSGYSNHGCRCTLCVGWRAGKTVVERQRRRAA